MAILKRFETKSVTDPDTGKRTRVKTEKVAGYQVQINRYDPSTGARAPVTIGTYRTKKEAEAAERKALTSNAEGVLIDRSRETVSDLIDRWYETKKGTITPATLKTYEIAARVHLKPAIGMARLQELKPADVQTLINRWRDAVDPETDEPTMGAKTIRAAVSVLKQAYDQAVRERAVSVNPVAGAQLPTVKRRRTLKVWNPAAVDSFLSASMTDPLSPLWHLLVLEGMRRSEALGLRWSDLNWRDDGKVSAHISQTVLADYSEGGRARIADQTKTAAGARSVLLTAETTSVLRTHMDAQKFVRKAAGDAWTDNDLIVCTAIGTPINPSNVKRNQARIMKHAGVSELTTHDLRHTAATTMLLAGVPIKIVSEKLGHASVTITMDIYAHVLPDMQDQAADAMDAALARGRAANAKARAAAG